MKSNSDAKIAKTQTSTAYRAPFRLPIVGHLPIYYADKLGFLSRVVQEYGPAVRLQLGEATLLLTDPEDVHHVLVENSNNYSKTPRLSSGRGRKLFGNGLLTTSPSFHLKQRRLLQPAFTPREIRSYGDLILDRIEQHRRRFSEPKQIDMCREMEELAKSIIIGTLFGADFRDESCALTNAISDHRSFIEYIYGSLFPYPEHFPLPVVARERRARKTFTRIISESIAQRRKSDQPRQDLLSAFLSCKYDDGSSMPDQQVCDEAITMLSTGYETIGDALTWTWYLLARHPEIRERMLEEIDSVLGNRPPNVDDVAKLEYVNQVFSEALRLYPPTWIFVRIAQGDDRLPSQAVVTSGMKIYLCQYIMHRHPGWFPDPETFAPERFTKSNIERRHRFAYFPFGAGPRLCIGSHLARLEAILVIATLAQRYAFDLCHPTKRVVPKPGITLRPKHGLQMFISPRIQ